MTCLVCGRELRPGRALRVTTTIKQERRRVKVTYLCRRKDSPECFLARFGDKAKPSNGRSWMPA